MTSANISAKPSKPYLDYYPSGSSSYANIGSVQPPIASINKENLYTDPKLLEMIRKDLQDLNELKRSSVIGNSNYYGGSYSSYSNNYNPSYTPLSVLNNNQQVYYTSSNTLATNNNYCSMNKNNANLVDSVRSHQSRGNLQDNEIPSNQNTQKGEYISEEQEDGRKFEGYLVDGVKEGYGKLTYSDGAYYEGNFKEDKMHGKGTLYYGPDKPAYDGEWICDQFHGKGSLYNENPVPLNGSFNYNDFNLIEDFWVRYDGCFEGDNKAGEGILILSNGEEFRGNFENDYINGRGTFVTKDGEMISGLWEDNILVRMDA